jgi:hypothetical protein
MKRREDNAVNLTVYLFGLAIGLFIATLIPDSCFSDEPTLGQRMREARREAAREETEFILSRVTYPKTKCGNVAIGINRVRCTDYSEAVPRDWIYQSWDADDLNPADARTRVRMFKPADGARTEFEFGFWAGEELEIDVGHDINCFVEGPRGQPRSKLFCYTDSQLPVR